MRDLACGHLTCTEGLMLRKLIINDWVHVSSELVLEDRERMIKWHVPVWRGFVGRGSNAEKWGDHDRIENERRLSERNC